LEKSVTKDQTVLTRCTVALATGLGLGFSPFASGTVGSLWGPLIVWGMHASLPGLALQIVVAIALALLAIPICDVAEKVYGKKDDGRIVADEFLTFPICMLGLYDHMFTYWWVLPMCFVTNRIFDILKLPPARGLQGLHGGFGIVIDDVIACVHSLVVNWVLFYAITTYLLAR
jgi:phosphatidylglycerophosphatase A